MSISQAKKSRQVSSSQKTVHPGLEKVIQRHMQSEWRGRLHQPTVEMFNVLNKLVSDLNPGSIILDSGCGTGLSSRQLGDLYPDSLIVGVDKSTSRLAVPGIDESPNIRGNVILARMELASFWRLVVSAQWSVQRHYLLFPNPWPKSGHLLRRWHGHPAWPVLIELGGLLEMRCNWEVYAREFATALELSGKSAHLAPLFPGPVISLFEQKYRASGHDLWVVTSAL